MFQFTPQTPIVDPLDITGEPRPRCHVFEAYRCRDLLQFLALMQRRLSYTQLCCSATLKDLANP